LHVFEVDHPTTQTWKRKRLREAAIQIPRTITFSPVNFETETLEEGLRRAGFDTGKCSFFSWLGVTPYITGSAATATLRFIASLPPGSGVVFDYMISPSLLHSTARRALNGLASRVALAGEPLQTFFDPSSLRERLAELGFRRIEDLGPDDLNGRYFQARTDGLRVGTLAHVMNARV